MAHVQLTAQVIPLTETFSSWGFSGAAIPVKQRMPTSAIALFIAPPIFISTVTILTTKNIGSSVSSRDASFQVPVTMVTSFLLRLQQVGSSGDLRWMRSWYQVKFQVGRFMLVRTDPEVTGWPACWCVLEQVNGAVRTRWGRIH